MPKAWVAGDLPSALVRSGYQRVLSRPGDSRAVRCDLRHPVLTYQPFRGGRIDKRHIDLVAVLLAEVLKRPVGNKQINQLQLTSGN
jgi:hypothetical protein